MPSSKLSLRNGTARPVRAPVSSNGHPWHSIVNLGQIRGVDKGAPCSNGSAAVPTAGNPSRSRSANASENGIYSDRSEPLAVIKLPYAAPHSVCAFASFASNTGLRSPGEELMTCKASAVAVLPLQFPLVSLIRRTAGYCASSLLQDAPARPAQHPKPVCTEVKTPASPEWALKMVVSPP